MNADTQSSLTTATTSRLRIASLRTFNAVVGLFGMLQVCLGQRASDKPDDREVRKIEGWILGRKA